MYICVRGAIKVSRGLKSHIIPRVNNYKFINIDIIFVSTRHFDKIQKQIYVTNSYELKSKSDTKGESVGIH